jgi:phosphohistidine phosphatase
MTRARTYLLRHGEAEPPGRDGDAGRRLTPGGRSQLQAHFAALLPRLEIQRILSSPLRRSLETAEILAAAVGAPLEEHPGLASGSSNGQEILALAAAEGAGVALVGHNPELAQAIAIARGGAVGLSVPPGTLAAVDTDGSHFALAFCQVPPGSA